MAPAVPYVTTAKCDSIDVINKRMQLLKEKDKQGLNDIEIKIKDKRYKIIDGELFKIVDDPLELGIVENVLGLSMQFNPDDWED
jgi:hypothetical protein